MSDTENTTPQPTLSESSLDGSTCSAVSLESYAEFLKGAAIAYYRACKTASKTWYRQDVEIRDNTEQSLIHFAKRFGEMAEEEISKQNGGAQLPEVEE